MQLNPREVSEISQIAKQRARLKTAIANSKGLNGTLVGEEYCNCCGHYLGYSINTHIDHPIRCKDGAIYHDCVGQTCADCERKKPK
jgi:hypothetical protein